MKRYFTLYLLLTLTIITSCGFHTPTKLTSINAEIIAPAGHKFAKLLEKKLNKDLKPALIVVLGEEKNQRNIASYKKGVANGYQLSSNIEVSVYQGEKLLLKTTLTGSQYLPNTNDSLVTKLQYQAQYNNIRQALLAQFLPRLIALKKTLIN